MQRQSSLIYILKAFIPYSRENLALSFKPNYFFNELEKRSKYQRRTLNSAFKKAVNQGYIKRRNNNYRLTELGRKAVQPFVAKKLKGNARLMLIFDIPESQAAARRHLRWLLKKWDFEQVQKSVWITDFDHKMDVWDIAKELNIEDYLQLYECALALGP